VVEAVLRGTILLLGFEATHVKVQAPSQFSQRARSIFRLISICLLRLPQVLSQAVHHGFKPMSPVRWRDVNGQQEICCPKDGRCGPVAEGSVFDRSWISLSTRLHHNLTRRFAESEVPKHIGRGEELRD
jgi:hypothetical protein